MIAVKDLHTIRLDVATTIILAPVAAFGHFSGIYDFLLSLFIIFLICMMIISSVIIGWVTYDSHRRPKVLPTKTSEYHFLRHVEAWLLAGINLLLLVKIGWIASAVLLGLPSLFNITVLQFLRRT